MERVALTPGAVYRITGTQDVDEAVAAGEFVASFDSVLIFRNLELEPSTGFRTAWYVEWSELAKIEQLLPEPEA
jgi:hypothetical protein